MADNNLFKRSLKGFSLAPVDEEGKVNPEENQWDSWANNNIGTKKSEIQEVELPRNYNNMYRFEHKLVAKPDFRGFFPPTIALQGIPFSREEIERIINELGNPSEAEQLAAKLFTADLRGGRIPQFGFPGQHPLTEDVTWAAAPPPNGFGIKRMPCPNLHQRINPYSIENRSPWDYISNSVGFDSSLIYQDENTFMPVELGNYRENFLVNNGDDISREIILPPNGYRGGIIPYYRGPDIGINWEGDREWHPVYFLMVNDALGLSYDEWHDRLNPIHLERFVIGDFEVSRRMINVVMQQVQIIAAIDAARHARAEQERLRRQQRSFLRGFWEDGIVAWWYGEDLTPLTSIKPDHRPAVEQIIEISNILELHPFQNVPLRSFLSSLLEDDCTLELVVSDRRRSLEGARHRLFVDGKYKFTNFSLQTPLVEDSCGVEDLVNESTAMFSTATANGNYNLYLDPSIKYPANYPNPPEFWPTNTEFWDSILQYERQATPNTYYGDLSNKSVGAFPRHVDLKVPTYQASRIVDLLERLEPENVLYPTMFQTINDPHQSDQQAFHFYYNYLHERDSNNTHINSRSIFHSVPNYDLGQILERHGQGGGNQPPDLFGSRGESEENEEQEENNDCPPFVERIRMALTEQVVENVANDLNNAHTSHPYGMFLGMYSQEIQHIEPLFYKITRNLVPRPGQENSVGHLMVRNLTPILGAQPIFHSNKKGSQGFRFEDRFVDYSDTYQYDVEAFAAAAKVMFSTREMPNYLVTELLKARSGGGYEGLSVADYVYRAIREEFSFTEEDVVEQNKNLRFDWVCSKMGFDLLRLPYIDTRLREEDWISGVAYPPVLITDLPPIPPGVSIFPYRGIEDKMLFLFSLQTDRLTERYIYLNDEEKDKFEKIREQQKICSDEEDMINFQSEGDDVDKFQVFRTTNVPEAVVSENQSLMYQRAFGDEPHKVISKDLGSSLIDDIEPNTKYFYMFRTVDINGHVSNPSPIYRVEMVSEDGLIFPIIDLFIPKSPKKGTKYRKFAKHLEIKPSLLMAEPNWSTNEEDEIGWKIGSREESIFNRRFLIRLTSIDTGRKVDIQAKFKKKEEQIERNEEGDIGE